MRRGCRIAGLIACVALGITACSSSSGPHYSMTGSWAGVGQTDSVAMTVTQTGTSGGGHRGRRADSSTTVNGSATKAGSVSPDVRRQDGNTAIYSGTFSSATQIQGSFPVQGGTETITFNKQ